MVPHVSILLWSLELPLNDKQKQVCGVALFIGWFQRFFFAKPKRLERHNAIMKFTQNHSNPWRIFMKIRSFPDLSSQVVREYPIVHHEKQPDHYVFHEHRETKNSQIRKNSSWSISCFPMVHHYHEDLDLDLDFHHEKQPVFIIKQATNWS